METPKVGFLEAYKLFWLNYVNFKGRSRRSEYWWVALWHTIITLGAFILALITAFIPVIGWIFTILLIIAVFLYSIATIIPNLSMLVRRFHDVGWSMAIPVIAFIASIIYAIINAIATSSLPSTTDIQDYEVYMGYGAVPNWIGYPALILMIVLNLITFIVSLLDSKEEDNKYGQSPKYGRDYTFGYPMHGQNQHEPQTLYNEDMKVNNKEERHDLEEEKKSDPYRY